MTIDYRQAFSNLRQRRLGSNYNFVTEAYEDSCNKRNNGTGLNALKYALGAIAEVDSKYTKKLLEDGERIQECLKKTISADYEYQGSVPMNIHIRSNSDIDLLVLNQEFITFSLELSNSYPHAYQSSSLDPILLMQALRTNCERVLETRYYGATVDKSGDKSIKISGGSFARSVDVVPANWYHDMSNNMYNSQKQSVQIFNKTTKERLINKPFLFRDAVCTKNSDTNGRSNKMIRLLKNIKEDSSIKISKLSSYDIASLIWNMPSYNRLSDILIPPTDLKILVDLDKWFNSLEALDIMSFRTPDNTRYIFDDNNKIQDLNNLKRELSNLIGAIFKDIEPSLNINTSLENQRNRLLMEKLM